MTPANLAQLHARAMTLPAPWREADFAQLLTTPGIFLTTLPPSFWQKYPGESARGAAPLSSTATGDSRAQSLAFALGRVTLDEAELLTLAVDPAHHRQGLGRATLKAFETTAAEQGATKAFLEVAAPNTGALALYRAEGWHQTGLRKGYYRSEAHRIDAILMSKSLKPA